MQIQLKIYNTWIVWPLTYSEPVFYRPFYSSPSARAFGRWEDSGARGRRGPATPGSETEPPSAPLLSSKKRNADNYGIVV